NFTKGLFIHVQGEMYECMYLYVYFYGFIEELGQGSHRSSIKHPETDMSQPRFEPSTSFTAGRYSTRELLQQLTQFTILNLYNLNKCITAQRLCSASGVCIF
ncbi:MAG: hypothetical protein ACK56I_04855, partial [bacterium]